jgi:hypothetical protein
VSKPGWYFLEELVVILHVFEHLNNRTMWATSTCQIWVLGRDFDRYYSVETFRWSGRWTSHMPEILEPTLCSQRNRRHLRLLWWSELKASRKNCRIDNKAYRYVWQPASIGNRIDVKFLCRRIREPCDDRIRVFLRFFLKDWTQKFRMDKGTWAK